MKKLAIYHDLQSEQNTERLILDNLPLVKSIAMHLHCRLPKNICLDDLIQTGIVGLVEAAGRYHPEHGCSFATFANSRIRGAMIDDLRRNDVLPRSTQADVQKLQKVINFIEQTEGRHAHDAEIAAELQIDMQQYEELLQAINSHYTLSTDDVEISKQDQSEHHREYDELKKLLAEQISHLPEKEKLVLAMYYNEDLIFKEIGQVLEVSESRISQLHGQALTRLRARIQRVELESNDTSDLAFSE